MEGDITKVVADAIVNAANSALAGGGGVDGAIHRAGGPPIMAELDKIRASTGRCATGNAVVTQAGALPAKFVFHAVGPIYRSGDAQQAGLLASCYRTCLRLAEERGVRVITFPSISTGAYGYPLKEAAPIAVETVGEYLVATQGSVETAIFVLFGAASVRAYETAAARWRERRVE